MRHFIRWHLILLNTRMFALIFNTVMQRINNTLAVAHVVTYPLGIFFKSLAFIPNIASWAAALAFWHTIGGMNVSNIILM